MMKRFLLCFFFCCLYFSCKQSEAADKPNIILILADDLGYSDLGCYGSEILTPNLDRLAQSGLRFTQFYNNGKCAPSRASLITGLYPQQTKDGSNVNNVLNVAQVLKSAGYHTLMTGRSGGFSASPTKCGFDRFYGLLNGCCNYFNPGLRRTGQNEPGRKYPGEQRAWEDDGKIMQPFTPEDENFYATDAFTQRALDYLKQYGKSDKPFFLYLPFTAPHFPIHSRPEDIAKYRGKYMKGWDVIRKKRHRRLVDLGIISKHCGLAPRDPNIIPWDDLEDEEKSKWDLQMAVYAAMIDRMDQGIGQILSKLSQLEIEKNTLVLFLSDNGACAEDDKAFKATPRGVPPGPMESYRTQGVPWANLSNTPFRKFKWWVHEGGIASPLIISWPNVIKRGGKITNQIGHIMDIMPTFLDVAGVKYSDIRNDRNLKPLEGISLVPIFEGRDQTGREALYWQFGQCLAVRKGKWKLVASHPNSRLGIDFFKEGPIPKTDYLNEVKWELYDLETDGSEINNLALDFPDRVKDMSKLFNDWIKRVVN